MCSDEEKLDDFLNKFSNPLKVFREVCNKEKVKVRKEVEKYVTESEKIKKYLVEEAKQMFERNNTNFIKSKDFSGFKYKVELLQNDDTDHKTLRNSLGLGSETDSSVGLQNVVDFHIYRVKAFDDKVSKLETSDDQNILLLHGTKVSNVEGILKEGLKPSQKGTFGLGVYSTNSIITASMFGQCLVDDIGVFKYMIYLLTIKLKTSNNTLRKDIEYKQKEVGKERKVSFAKPNPTYENGKKINILRPFEQDCADKEKYVSEPPIYNPPIDPNLLSSSKVKFDSNNDKILEGTFTEEEEITFLSHHDLVTPAYLVEIELATDLRRIVKHLLYKIFDFCELKKTNGTMLKPRSSCKDSTSQISSNKRPTYSVETFINELKKEIEANQKPQIKLLESQFYHSIKLLIPQLTFEVSSLFNSLKEDSVNYKTVSLESSDKDYNFVMRSLNDKGFVKFPKVLHMFRIVPADQSNVKVLYSKYLYLQGTTADKVMNILKQG